MKNKELLLNKILSSSEYPSDWQLSNGEIENLYLLAKSGLATMDGDTKLVEITTRQLLLLLKSYAESK